jgi:chromosome partitioning protein
MRRIAIINQKGGVGKTTTAVNLSAALSNSRQQVTLLDLDPQAHASLHLGLDPDASRANIYQVLLGNASLADARYQLDDRLAVVPSHIDLAAADLELGGEVGRELILRDKLSHAGWEDDYLLIDCPPSLGLLTLNALAAVDEVFLPLQPHFLALHGLSKLLGTIEAVSGRLNRQLRLTGVVLCMYESGTRLASEVSSDVESFFKAVQDPQCPWSGARIFKTRVRRNIRLAEAPSFGQSIFDYAPESHGAEDYRNLVQEVLRMPAAKIVPRPAAV